MAKKGREKERDTETERERKRGRKRERERERYTHDVCTSYLASKITAGDAGNNKSESGREFFYVILEE